ncbi:solute carrier family 23 protein [Slackia sp.]|uniref:solute carrier family 23 protein n=1 Tax=Slackia sp. TaxID=2049041 RepID=UPI002E763DEC|nr:solute carrier family 23 protein [Slackia sp.]MEE0519173.1 solute carrier family 23 protein [Slackia sp.]
MATDRPIIGVDDRVPVTKAIPLGIQHFMSMFGSTVLVPFLTGLSPSLAIMCSGIGTILYLLVTRGKIPSYLGSSFAFITPIAMVASSQGVGAVGGALIVTGLVYVAVAGVIKVAGTGWLDFILPAPVVAPVIVVIGLGLSATAVKMAFFNGGYDSGAPFNYEGFAVAALTLAVSVVFSTCFKGFWSTIPVLIGVLVGYAASCILGLVDFQPIADAAWIGLPTITAPTFDLGAIILIAPVAIVIIIEHIGHLLVVGEVIGKNYNDMLPRSLLGDGLSTMVSGFLGGTPTTTYAENIGVMSATRVYSTQIFWYAGGIAFIVGGFCPKIEAIINSIPTSVMGGVSLLLFGLIASNGLRMLVSNRVDFSKARNLMLVSAILVVGVGMETAGIKIPVGAYEIPGMATSAIVGVILNLCLPKDTVADKTYPAGEAGGDLPAENQR